MKKTKSVENAILTALFCLDPYPQVGRGAWFTSRQVSVMLGGNISSYRSAALTALWQEGLVDSGLIRGAAVWRLSDAGRGLVRDVIVTARHAEMVLPYGEVDGSAPSFDDIQF